MRRPTIHIIGAGVSGLSAAVHLRAASDVDIVVHDKAEQPGGRQRAFYDEELGKTIDSGNHFLLAGWRSTLATIGLIGAREQWSGAASSDICFADMASGERWKLRPNAGRIPWWTLSSKRRAPRTWVSDYLPVRKLQRAGASAVVADFAPREGPAAERLWGPFVEAALNVDPQRASARLAGAALMDVLGRGGRGARMMFPIGGLTRAFVEPALKYLRRRDALIRCERELGALEFEGDRVAALEFEHDRVDLAPGDALILAVPPWVAGGLVPGLSMPTEFTAMLTAHFTIAPPPDAPRVTGVVNGPFRWMFCWGDLISVSVGEAGAVLETPCERLASDYWGAVAGLTGLSDETPGWRMLRQKRGSFAPTPAQDALRPSCPTPWRNLFLAGAYVQNGLPESLEGAVRSGEVAARWAVSRASAPLPKEARRA